MYHIFGKGTHVFFFVNLCPYKTGANTEQEKYLYLFSCKYKTGIDVLWPGAISCQTVLTAPINDPNPPFMDEYKTQTGDDNLQSPQRNNLFMDG